MTELSIQPTKGLSQASCLSVRGYLFFANKPLPQMCPRTHVHTCYNSINEVIIKMEDLHEGTDTGDCSFITLECG